MWLRNAHNNPPPRKGRRCRKPKHTQVWSVVNPSGFSFLLELPPPLLSRVLDFLLPIDVLSLSRICTTVRKGLSRDGCLGGKWMEARNRFAIKRVPDPPEGVSEVEWAAFVFDGGKCQICGKWTRVRDWSTTCLWHCHRKFCLDAAREYERMEEKQPRKRHSNISLKFTSEKYMELLEWRKLRDAESCNIARKNDAFWRSKADRLSKEVRRKDLANAPSLLRLLRYAKVNAIEINESDWKFHSHDILSECQSLYGKDRRKQTQSSIRKLGTNIQHLWSQLRERATRADIIPPYTEFLRLPFLSRLQQGEATLSEDSIFDHTTVQQIKQEIDKWVIAFKGSLQVTVVDHPGTEHDEDAIHPTERFTTVFACESCSGRLYAEGTRDLDLQGICDHTNCLESWIPAKFSHDMVRSNILRAVLVNNQLSENHIHNRLDRFQCMKCPFPLVLHGTSEVLGHERWHDDIDVTYLPPIEPNPRYVLGHVFSPPPPTLGKVQDAESRNAKKYLCRQCSGASGVKRSFSYAGLCCHLKFKHDIVLVTENDYFVHHQDLVTAFQF